MKFMGSKARIAKHILPLILTERTENQLWVEPFVGGGNMIDKVSGRRLGCDTNPHVIAALTSIRDKVEELPKNNEEFTEADYQKAKTEHPHKGYVGFALSYGGKWFGGWRRDGAGRRDYVAEAYRNALKQAPLLLDVELQCKGYEGLTFGEPCLIYCDPPYEGTTQYGTKFDSDVFWRWCRVMSAQGHTVFVSEYNAPEDFTCLWEGRLASSLTKNTGSKRATEKLFKAP